MRDVDLLFETIRESAQGDTLKTVQGVLIDLHLHAASFVPGLTTCTDFEDALSKLRYAFKELEHIKFLRVNFYLDPDIANGIRRLQEWDILNVSVFRSLEEFSSTTIGHHLLKPFFQRHKGIEVLTLGRCGGSAHAICPLSALQESKVKIITATPSCIGVIMPRNRAFNVLIGPKTSKHMETFPLHTTLETLRDFTSITSLTLNVSPTESDVLFRIAESCPALKRLFLSQISKVRFSPFEFSY